MISENIYMYFSILFTTIRFKVLYIKSNISLIYKQVYYVPNILLSKYNYE